MAHSDVGGSIVQAPCGAVRGCERDGCLVYLGMPFAKPPIGGLAFRHPEPPGHWEGVLEAVRGSANPVQAPGGFVIGNNSLDCLYLIVFAPVQIALVWVHWLHHRVALLRPGRHPREARRMGVRAHAGLPAGRLRRRRARGLGALSERGPTACPCQNVSPQTNDEARALQPYIWP